jgi:transposase, IS30 family
VDIDQRPAAVDARSRIGDWEADLVCGTEASGYLVTLLERISRRVLIGYTKTKFADQVTAEILRLPKNSIVETLTFDNGKEFAGHEQIATKLGCKCFFAKPYHSWERGANENTNGLIRQYFPKKISFTKITANEIAFVQHRLNTRPRKCLDFKPPNTVHFSHAA